MSKEKIHKVVTILAVGGLDPSGGAGILIDSAAIRSLGLHAAAVTALTTVQDGSVFRESKATWTKIVSNSVDAVLSSQNVGAVKTGALGNANIIEALAKITTSKKFPPLIIDPVLKSTSGGVLLNDDGLEALIKHLIPKAYLITPNLDEAEILAQMPVRTVEQMKEAAFKILALGCDAVLIKGGHLGGETSVDVLVDQNTKAHQIKTKRLNIDEIRGTGCALASLIAGYIAMDFPLNKAVYLAKQKLTLAMQNSVAIDRKNGPRVLKFS